MAMRVMAGPPVGDRRTVIQCRPCRPHRLVGVRQRAPTPERKVCPTVGGARTPDCSMRKGRGLAAPGAHALSTRKERVMSQKQQRGPGGSGSSDIETGKPQDPRENRHPGESNLSQNPQQGQQHPQDKRGKHDEKQHGEQKGGSQQQGKTRPSRARAVSRASRTRAAGDQGHESGQQTSKATRRARSSTAKATTRRRRTTTSGPSSSSSRAASTRPRRTPRRRTRRNRAK